MRHIAQRLKLKLTDTTLQASDHVSCPQVFEPRIDALGSSMAAFDYLTGWVLLGGHGGRSSLLPLVVVAVEAHQKVILKKVGIWE